MVEEQPGPEQVVRERVSERERREPMGLVMDPERPELTGQVSGPARPGPTAGELEPEPERSVLTGPESERQERMALLRRGWVRIRQARTTPWRKDGAARHPDDKQQDHRNALGRWCL